jgi:hypothetical protein
MLLQDFHHRSNFRGRKLSSRLLEVIDDILNDFAQLPVNLDGIVAVDAGNEIGTFADVDLILVAPFDPAMVGVNEFHPADSSMARCTCRSWYGLASSPS